MGEFNPENYTIKELKNYLRERLTELEAGYESDGFGDLPILSDEVGELIRALKADSRKGANQLAVSLEKKQLAASIDLKAWEKRNQLVVNLKEEGYQYVCGIDEAGRGPMAGPVAVGAVILPVDIYIAGLDDSKKLSASKRESLTSEIREKAISSAVAMIDNQTIDEVNIGEAVRLAARTAISRLDREPDYLVLDGGLRLDSVDLPQQAVIDGDARVNPIAAASVLAKVTRDNLMDQYHQEYPAYNFLSNKGYGTAEHMAAIEEYGPSPIHRRSFIN
ncbi:MAG: ribonuclease HII [Bacillota bacterium]